MYPYQAPTPTPTRAKAMTIARKVTPKAALFVHFLTTVVRENWTIDGVELGDPGRTFLHEIGTALDELERLSLGRLRRRKTLLVEQAIDKLDAPPARTLAGELELLHAATERLDRANELTEQILARNGEAHP